MPTAGEITVRADLVIPTSSHGVPRSNSVVSDIALCFEGKRLIACGDDHIVRVFDLDQNKVTAMLEIHTDWIQAIDYSEATRLVATAGNDRSIMIWSIAKEGQVGTVTPQYAIRDICFDSLGTQLAVVGFDNCLRIYDGSKGWEVASETMVECDCDDLSAVVFSPTDLTIGIVGRNGYVGVWEVTTKKMLWQKKADLRRMRALAFSHNGESIATSGDGGWISILDAKSGKLVNKILSGQGKIFALEFCGNDLLATAGSSNDIRVWNWNLPEGTKAKVATMSGHTGTITSLSYDAKTYSLYSGSFDTTIQRFNLGQIYGRGPKPKLLSGLNQKNNEIPAQSIARKTFQLGL